MGGVVLVCWCGDCLLCWPRACVTVICYLFCLLVVLDRT